MAKLPMFRQDPNDSEGGYLLSMPGLLALVGATAYEADDAVTPQGRANAKYALARILSAARAGGFTQGDLLDTLFSNGEVSQRLHDRGRHRKRKIKHVKPASTPGASGTELARTRPDKGEISKGRTFEFKAACVVPSLYRPFTKQWLYFNRTFNEMVLQMPRIFPKAGAENLLIMVKQRMSNEGQFVLMVNSPPELQTDGGSQCFPLYLYNIAEKRGDATEDRPDGFKQQTGLFAEENSDLFEAAAAQPTATKYERRDAINDAGLAHFQEAYPGEIISKEDLFYYVYGLLHSSDYRERYADNLARVAI